MSQRKLLNNKILSASIWNFIGTFLLKAIAFISVPILTRIMEPSDYGIVSTYATYISFMGIFIGLSLNTASTNARIDFADRYGAYNSSVIKASTVVFVLELIIANILYPVVEQLFIITRLYLNIVFFIAYAEYIVNTYYKINTVDYKFKQNLRISVTNAISSIVLSVIFIGTMKNDIMGRLLGQGLFVIIVACFIYYIIAFKRSNDFQLSDVKYALKLAFPNIFHQTSNMIMSQSDRVFILNMCGSISVAKYSVVYNFGLIMQMVWNAINDVWVPWLYRALHDKKTELIVRISKVYLYIFTFMASIAMLVVPDCMIIFAPASYNDAKSIIPVVILATYFIFLYSFFANVEIYNKKNKYMAIATTVTALTNIVGNAIFIPIYGYEAAAYTTLGSYVILMIMHYFFLTFLLKKNFYKLRMFMGPIIYMVLISVFTSRFLNNLIARYACLMILVFCGLIWGLKNKKHIVTFAYSMRR